MNTEIAAITECLVALIAGEWFLTRMSPKVHSQVVFQTELLVTLGAREWFRFCVRHCCHWSPRESPADGSADTNFHRDERRLKRIRSFTPTEATLDLPKISLTASCIS